MSTSSIPMANLRLSVSKLNSGVTPVRNRNRESGRRLTKSSPPEEVDLTDVSLEDEEPIPWCELHCKPHYKIACFVTFLLLAIITIIVLVVYYQTHDLTGKGKKPGTVNRKDTYPYGSAPPSWTESVDNGPILRNFGSDKKSSPKSTTTVTETSPFSENSNAAEALSTKTSTSSTEESVDNGPKLRDFGSDTKPSQNSSTAVPETSPFSETDNATEALSTNTSTEKSVDDVPKLRDFGLDMKPSQNSTTAVTETMSSSENSSMSEALTTKTSTSTTEVITKSMSDNETKSEQTTEASLVEKHAVHEDDANSSPAPNLQQKGWRKRSTLPESSEESTTPIPAATVTNYKIDSDKKSRMLNNEVRKRPIILTTVHKNAINFNLPVYDDASTVSRLNVIDEKPTTQSQHATTRENSETRGSLFSQIHAHFVNLFGENPTEKPNEIQNLSTASFKNENLTSTESSGTFTQSLLSTDASSNTINLENSHNFPKNSTSNYENSTNFNSSKISVNFIQTQTTAHFNEQNLSSLQFSSTELSEISRAFNISRPTTASSNFDQNLSLSDENPNFNNSEIYYIEQNLTLIDLNISKLSRIFKPNASLDNLTDLSINSTSTKIFGNSQTLNQNLTATPGFNKTSTSSYEISTTTTHFSEQTSPSQNLSWTDGENVPDLKTIKPNLTDTSDFHEKSTSPNVNSTGLEEIRNLTTSNHDLTNNYNFSDNWSSLDSSKSSTNAYNSDYDNVTSFNGNLTVIVLDKNSSNFSNDAMIQFENATKSNFLYENKTFTNISSNVPQDAAMVVARMLSSSSTTSPTLMNSSINSELDELDVTLTPV